MNQAGGSSSSSASASGGNVTAGDAKANAGSRNESGEEEAADGAASPVLASDLSPEQQENIKNFIQGKLHEECKLIFNEMLVRPTVKL